MEKEIKKNDFKFKSGKKNRFKDNLNEKEGNGIKHKKFLDMHLLKNGNNYNTNYNNNGVNNDNNFNNINEKKKMINNNNYKNNNILINDNINDNFYSENKNKAKLKNQKKK